MKLVLVGAALLAAFPLLAADDIDPRLLDVFEARVFEDSSGATLRYRLFRPPAYHATNQSPLVLVLHGAAGLGEDNTRQFNGGNQVPPAYLSSPTNQAKFPCFVFVPQCPRGQSWSSIAGRPSEPARLALVSLFALRREFRLDPDRFYLIGLSMGGSGAWDMASRYPSLFAAAVPICGSGDPARAASLIRLPIWCFHGEKDPLVPVNRARDMIAAIKQAGGHPRYSEFPGVGHDSYRNAFADPEFLPWLFAQKRSRPPATN